MAQLIYCDADGCEKSADIMVTVLGNGEVQAFCSDHYAELVFAMASGMIEAEAEEIGQGEQKVEPDTVSNTAQADDDQTDR